MRLYVAVCDCGLRDEYVHRTAAARKVDTHNCADYRTSHRRSCRSCGWSGVYSSRGIANRVKREHSCDRHLKAVAARARRQAREAATDRNPKPCLHKRADHQHGTHAAYVFDRCRCRPCTNASTAYETNRSRQQAYGRWNPYVDAAEARGHVRWLMDQGMGLKRIAAVAGVPHGGLWKLVYGKRQPDGAQVPSKRLRQATHDRVMATRLDLAAGARVPATGTHRRVQALVAIGWSQSKIAGLLGATPANLGTMMSRPAVTRRTHDTVTALYDEWSMRLPPETNQRERIAASRARNHARRHDWAPPLAWDDDTLDNPDARPTIHVDIDDTDDLDEAAIIRRMAGDRGVHVTKAEKAEIVRRLRAQKVPDNETQHRTGINTLRYAPRQRDLPGRNPAA